MIENIDMVNEDFLSKEEELELGTLIQKSIKAEKKMQSKTVSEEEMIELQEMIAQGQDAVEKLVKANLKLVHKQANNFRKKMPIGQDYEDIVQDGLAGLMIAVRKYDPKRNNKFSTVAYHWIKQSIIRESNKKARLVRLPENRINDYTHLNRMVSKLDQDNMSKKEIDSYILDNTDLKKKDLINIMGAAMQHTSLNKVVGDAENGKELIDFISDDLTTTSSENSYLNEELKNTIVELIRELPEVKKDIVLSFFKFNKDVSTEMVREKHGINKSKFKKYQMEAVKEMRVKLRAKGYSYSDFVVAE